MIFITFLESNCIHLVHYSNLNIQFVELTLDKPTETLKFIAEILFCLCFFDGNIFPLLQKPKCNLKTLTFSLKELLNLNSRVGKKELTFLSFCLYIPFSGFII